MSRASSEMRKATSLASEAGEVHEPGARAGSIERSTDLLDAIIGVRGRFPLGTGGRWFVPYHLDIGTGSSDFTWQGLLGIGYAYKWGEVLLSYRYLQYEEGDDKFLQDLKLGGLGVGVNFRF